MMRHRRHATFLLATLLAFLSGTAGAQDAREFYDARPIIVTPEQEAAVEAGLAWLATNQAREGTEKGSWTAKVGYKLNANAHKSA